MSGWIWWAATTAVEAGVATVVLVGAGRLVRLAPGWESSLALLALLGFVVPAGWGIGVPLPFPAGGGRELAEPGPFGVLLMVLVAAQAAGVAVSAGLLIRARRRARRLLEEADLIRAGSLTGEVEVVAAALGVPVPSLALTHGVGPAVVGIRRPTILLPRTLADDPRSLRAVLAHEVAHVARFDLATAMIRRLVLGLWWFHPAAWLAAPRHAAASEAECDDLALATLDAPSGEYADAVIACARTPRPGAAAPAGARLDGHPLEARIRRLLDPTRPPEAGSAVGTLIVALAMASLIIGVHPDPALAGEPDDRIVRVQQIIRYVR